MKVSIIIPLYNSRTTIGQTLEACRHIDWADLEIIVVDDGSTDDSAAIARRYDVTLLKTENHGPAHARNIGWRASSGDICWFTDSDCLPRQDALRIIMPHFKNKKVGGVGGGYGIANKNKLLARLIHAEINYRHRRMGKEVDFIGSFNMAVRRTVLEETGGFNEQYTTASGEDNDLSYRMIDAGYQLMFEQEAKVAHFHEARLTNYLRQQFNHGKWRVKLYKDHKKKKRGDSYSGIFDFIQPIFALLLLAELPLLLSPTVRYIYLIFAATYIVMQLPMPISMVIKTSNTEALLLPPITLLRGFARGLGLAVGVMRFGL